MRGSDAAASGMRLTYFGHSCFRVQIGAVRLVLDPWLATNPHGAVPLAEVPCDYVLCTHAHEDHICDALELARLHRATLIAPYELAEYFSAQGPACIDLMPGGGIDLPWGRVQMTPAIHSSAMELPHGENRAMGVASGYVIRGGSRTLYHAGDTALFGDMQLIGRHGLDIALVPIGDRYTMGITDAIDALALLRPRMAVPMHYNSHDGILADPHAFVARAAAAGRNARVMTPGETIEV